MPPVALCAALCLALPRVLVLSDPGAPTARFVEALQIQLAGAATVEPRSWRPPSLVPDRLAAAADRVAREDATLALWIEETPPAGAERVFVVFAVAQREPRALVEVARFRRVTDEAETHRELALKVAALLDHVLSSARAPDLVRPVARATPAATVAAPSRLLLEAGGIFAGGAGSVGSQAGAGLGIGARFPLGDPEGWWAEAYAATRLVETLDAAGRTGRVSLREWYGGAGLRLVHGGPRLRVGVALEAGARLLDVEGTAADGRAGQAWRIAPTVAPVGLLRIGLGDTLALCLAAGAEVALLRHRFDVGGGELADLGAVRPLGAISLVFAPL